MIGKTSVQCFLAISHYSGCNRASMQIKISLHLFIIFSRPLLASQQQSEVSGHFIELHRQEQDPFSRLAVSDDDLY